MKLIICLKCHLGSSVLESGSTDSVTKTPITPGGKQAEEKNIMLNHVIFCCLTSKLILSLLLPLKEYVCINGRNLTSQLGKEAGTLGLDVSLHRRG